MLKSNNPLNSTLKKNLGIGFGIAMSVGGTIGVGILRTPGRIAILIPDYWLIVLCWLTGGVIAMLSAISFAELCTMIPKAGGPYNYVKRAFGDYPGFLVGWFHYTVSCVSTATFCIVISEYISLLYPEIIFSKTMIGISVLSMFTTIHLISTKTGSLLIQVTSLIKILLFLILIIACFITGRGHSNEIHNTSKAFSEISHGSLFRPFFMALQFVMGAYSGWWKSSIFAEEDKNPGKNIPKSLFIGVIVIILVYVLTNAALFFVVPVPEAANSPLVASNAAGIIFGKSGSFLLLLFALLSILSILNAEIMIPSRILYGLSRDALFFPQAVYVNKGGTPAVALLFSFAIQLVLILISSFEELFKLGAYLAVIIIGLSLTSVIRLRSTEPNLSRPYRAWGYPYTTIVSIIIMILIFFGFAFNDQKSFLIIAVISLVSYPCFRLLKKTFKQDFKSSP